MDIIEEGKPDTVPTELPADSPSVLSADSWDEVQSLLDDFDRKTAAVDSPSEPTADNQETAPSDFDKQINDLIGYDPADRQRIEQLTGEIGSLRAAELDRQSRQDFEGFARKLQADCGPNVDESFARTNLLAALAERPELAVVWQHRHVTDEQLRAAERELQQLEVLHMRAQQAPDDPRKAQTLAWMEQRGYQLGLMLNSRKILNDVWRDVQKRASKVLPAIDADATQIHDDVAWAVRQARTGDLPEPPVNLGQLSDAEFRNFTRKNYGF
jgi:hypothetical protein